MPYPTLPPNHYRITVDQDYNRDTHEFIEREIDYNPEDVAPELWKPGDTCGESFDGTYHRMFDKHNNQFGWDAHDDTWFECVAVPKHSE